MLGSGQRARSRVTFSRRVAGGDDGYGNTLPDAWTDLATVSAAFRPKFGKEQLEAGRLESTMQGVLTVLRSPATAGVTSADRVVFISGPYAGKACQIRSIVPMPDNREIEMMIEEGGAL